MKTPVYETEQIERILKKTGGFYILHDTTRMQRENIKKYAATIAKWRNEIYRQ